MSLSCELGRSNGLKKFAWLLALIFSLWAGQVHAADLTFTKFHSDITVKTDASIVVTETMTADFTTDHHGIYRTIPYKFQTLNGGQASIPIKIDAVKRDGRTDQYSTTNNEKDLTLKIGDPNTSISGSHEYTIVYTAQVAVNFFADHDELYWNASGTTWDAPVSNISATIHLPGNFTAEQVTTACYTGPTGSTDKNCQQSHTSSTATFSSDDYLTVVVGWPVGVVTKPTNFDQLRAAGTSTTSSLTKGLHGWMLSLNIFLPLAALAIMFYLWWTRGRDPGQHRTIIAQYDPPDQLRPAELYGLLHERVSASALPATIVDLAVRGYLKILQTESKKMLGLSHKDEYILRSLKAPDEKLREFERDLLVTLFAEKLFPANDNDLRMADLKKRKYTSNPFTPIFSSAMSPVVDDGYFQGHPTKVRILWVVGGVVVGGLGGLLVGGNVPLFGLIATGLIVIFFANAMPRRTAKGVEAAWIGHGFKLFLAAAEKYRIKWQERKNIFETFLPYAMIFGIADKWSKALGDVTTTNPTWYEGQPGMAFNTMVFWGAMSSFGSSVNASVVSAAASGSSGFGGGGFSGGGGGGGGGGGW